MINRILFLASCLVCSWSPTATAVCYSCQVPPPHTAFVYLESVVVEPVDVQDVTALQVVAEVVLPSETILDSDSSTNGMAL